MTTAQLLSRIALAHYKPELLSSFSRMSDVKIDLPVDLIAADEAGVHDVLRPDEPRASPCVAL